MKQTTRMSKFLKEKCTDAQGISTGNGTKTSLSCDVWVMRMVILVGSLLALAIFIRNAWVTEDAYITFRSIEQFIAGNGPRWNPHERVQVFTHPLWFLILSSVRIVSRDVFINALVVSLICCAGMIYQLRNIAASYWHWFLGVLALVSSKAWVDFATSGLETPLTYLLVTVFILLLLRLHAATTRGERALTYAYAKGLGIIFSLSLVNRLDLATLLTVPLLWALWVWWRVVKPSRRWMLIVAAAVTLPIGLWTLFSVIYYGFPFPNTAYAKLATGIPAADYILQGIHYIEDSAQMDPITLLTMAVAVITAFISRRAPLIVVAVGIIVNILYIIRIGGDFMSGRFFVAAFVSAVCILVAIPWRKTAWVVASCVLVFANASCQFAPWCNDLDYREGKCLPDIHGIADERGCYFKTASFLAYVNSPPNEPFPTHDWVKRGIDFAYSDQKMTVAGNIGFFGYYARLDQIIIDPLALSDPFLARQKYLLRVRIGHFERAIPDAFLKSIADDVDYLQDIEQRVLYDELNLITRGPIFSMDRWLAILHMNGIGA